MKKSQRILIKPMLFVLLFATLCFTGMSSCESINEHEDIGLTEGVNKQGGETTQDPDPCANQNRYWDLTVTLLPAASYPDYDLAFKLEGSAPIVLPPCHCRESYLRITLSTDVTPFDLIASIPSYSPGATPNIIYSTDIIDEGDGKTNTYFFDIPSGDGDVVLFNFKDGMILTAAAIETLIDNAGGICIVDNIHDPHG